MPYAAAFVKSLTTKTAAAAIDPVDIFLRTRMQWFSTFPSLFVDIIGRGSVGAILPPHHAKHTPREIKKSREKLLCAL